MFDVRVDVTILNNNMALKYGVFRSFGVRVEINKLAIDLELKLLVIAKESNFILR